MDLGRAAAGSRAVTGRRVHPLSCVPQERAGVNRAEERLGNPPLRRTRADLFEGVWPEVLGWLQQEPDATAAELMDRLIRLYPERYGRRQLRTLRRGVGK